jgi:hypothetical protein
MNPTAFGKQECFMNEDWGKRAKVLVTESAKLLLRNLAGVIDVN